MQSRNRVATKIKLIEESIRKMELDIGLVEAGKTPMRSWYETALGTVVDHECSPHMRQVVIEKSGPNKGMPMDRFIRDGGKALTPSDLRKHVAKARERIERLKHPPKVEAKKEAKNAK